MEMISLQMVVSSHPITTIILQMEKNNLTEMISHPTMTIILLGTIGLGMTRTLMMKAIQRIKMVIKMDQITIMMGTRIGRIGLGGTGVCSSRNALLSNTIQLLIGIRRLKD